MKETKTMLMVDGVELNYLGLPRFCRETMHAYLEWGCKPGSGFLAILHNDLGAIVIVDPRTLAHLSQIYTWLVNHAPSQAWGSPEKVSAWMKARKAERKEATA